MLIISSLGCRKWLKPDSTERVYNSNSIPGTWMAAEPWELIIKSPRVRWGFVGETCSHVQGQILTRCDNKDVQQGKERTKRSCSFWALVKVMAESVWGFSERVIQTQMICGVSKLRKRWDGGLMDEKRKENGGGLIKKETKFDFNRWLMRHRAHLPTLPYLPCLCH